MAPLKVIGAGVSRTGTDSLRTALNMLGYNTHHMRSMLAGDCHPELFIEAFKHPEKDADWDFIYEDYDAAVDCPTFTFIDRLIKYYPDAKVILTKRDADSWYKSVLNTIYKFHELLPEDPQDYAVQTRDMVKTVFLNGSFQDMQKFKDDPETMKARYLAHNEWVIKTVPADRLLVLDLCDGITWDKICPFLGRPVPDEPYPHVNTTKSLNDEYPKLLELLAKQESTKNSVPS
ncbi:P-loop containing nucleoside triphosphate hydrolase protein [Fennellomyces sp. T-0311]|nr:P-loop containing nucleoside triphosphate hydrolase protein [Fennellomyces sp. T-0311]